MCIYIKAIYRAVVICNNYDREVDVLPTQVGSSFVASPLTK